jgi:hypothetical protein
MNFENALTVRQVARANPAFTEASLRWLLFNSATNGLDKDGVIIRLGKRVLIDRDKFGLWLIGRRVAAEPQKEHTKETRPRIDRESEQQPLIQIGVYVLWDGIDVVYVGHSNHVMQRILQHAKRGLVFDTWSLIKCWPEDMLNLERQLIQKYQPPLNISGKKKDTQ